MPRRRRLFPIENTRGTVCGNKKNRGKTKARAIAPTRSNGWDGSRRPIVVSFPRPRPVPAMFRALTRRMTSRARASTPSSQIVRHRVATAANAARDAAPVWTGDEAREDGDGAARARNVFVRFGSPEAVTFAHRGIASGVEAEVRGWERDGNGGGRSGDARAKRGVSRRRARGGGRDGGGRARDDVRAMGK